MSDGSRENAFDRTLHVVLRERVRERPRELNNAAGFGTIAALIGAVAWTQLGPVIGSVLVGFGVLLLRVSFFREGPATRETVTRPARVRISAEGVAIEGEELVRRERIAQAYYQPRRTGLGSVRGLDDRGAVLFDLEVKSEAERNEVLRALGRDVAHGRATFPLAPPPFATPFRRMVAIVAVVALVLAALWARDIPSAFYASLASLVVLLAAITIRQRVEVGVDGLVVRWLGRTRFVRYDAIRGVLTQDVNVEIAVADGAPLLLAPSAGTTGRHAAELARDALVARIEEARRAYDSRLAAGDLVTRVGRADRPVDAWRVALEQMHHDAAAGYRDPAARDDDLWRVVEDAGAPDDARAGAAVALRSQEGATERLRIAADAVASPRLRIALEKASDPTTDESALEEALDAVAPAPRASRTARE